MLSPIPGRAVDPAPKDLPGTAAKIDARSEYAGIGFRAFLRFSFARASLLAAGTAYYVFLSLFALIALAFGIAVKIGSDDLTQGVSDALSSAFPGLVNQNAINPESLQSLAASTSIVGLVVLLYSGAGAMTACSNSLHLIYGAPMDPRNYVLSKARLIAWLLPIAPLILVSFAPSLVVTTFAAPVVEFLGLPDTLGKALLVAFSVILSIGVSVIVLWLLLGHLGGVQPAPRPRLIGSLVGAAGIEVLKYLMASIITWSVSRPQYGAFAVPISVLFVMYLLCVVTYGSAALTAAMAEDRTQ